MITKRDYINEILRLNRVLTQQKYNSEEDKHIKALIAENLREIAKIDKRNAEDREDRKYKNAVAKLNACI